MPVNAALRLLSLAITALMCAQFSPKTFDRAYLAIGFAHYLLAFVYSRRHILRILSGRQTLLAAAGLAAAGSIVTLSSVPDIVLYFGLHHVLTESYLLQSRRGRAEDSLLRARLVFNAAAYCLILRHQVVFKTFPSVFLLACTVISFAAVLCFLYRARPFLSAGEFRDGFLFDALGFAAALLSIKVHVPFWPLVLYHFLFWCFLPAVRMIRAQASSGKLFLYGVLTAVLTGFFYALTGNFSRVQLTYQINLWGYIHITASFAISVLNPVWVRKFFNPAAGISAAVTGRAV